MEADLQKIYDGILALMDKNLILSARRITGAEGHQQRTPKRSSKLNRAQRSERGLRCSQERHESCETYWREDLQSGGNPRTTTPTGYEPKELAIVSRIEAYSGDPCQSYDVEENLEKKITELLSPKK